MRRLLLILLLIFPCILNAKPARQPATQGESHLKLTMPQNTDRCGWCVAEAILRYAGHVEAADAAAKRQRGCCNADIMALAGAHGVKMTQYWRVRGVFGDANVPYIDYAGGEKAIRAAIAKGRPCFVDLVTADPKVFHAVAVVGCDGQGVSIVDPNTPNVVARWTWLQFQNQWWGTMMCVPSKGDRND